MLPQMIPFIHKSENRSQNEHQSANAPPFSASQTDKPPVVEPATESRSTVRHPHLW
ncbi:Hypothetical protein PSEBR_m1648 [Pseudomonas brassicacearum subsp. brassicacearum NFM421]|uniref:Uncharacterized protein n=1 Tax=Pseudomonas brassicacearum (strain NFM421) TaxID=994484 RepID=F2K602_PSEBN|nr:Hypothetical protein PSEBR_m1648 [Pseudomonas brassicacearum subsp. brassicacearum NFM421]